MNEYINTPHKISAFPTCDTNVNPRPLKWKSHLITSWLHITSPISKYSWMHWFWFGLDLCIGAENNQNKLNSNGAAALFKLEMMTNPGVRGLPQCHKETQFSTSHF